MEDLRSLIIVTNKIKIIILLLLFILNIVRQQTWGISVHNILIRVSDLLFTSCSSLYSCLFSLSSGNNNLSSDNKSKFHLSDLVDNTEETKSHYEEEDDIREKTKKMMSLAGNLLDSEYAKNSPLNNVDDQDLDNAIREKAANHNEDYVDQSSSNNIVSVNMNEDKLESPEINKISTSPNLKGREAASSSGFMVRNKNLASPNSSNKKVTSFDMNNKQSLSSELDDYNIASLPNSDDDKNMEHENGVQQDLDQQDANRKPLRRIEYDQNGRKLVRSRSGELVPSRDIKKTNKKATGRYRIENNKKLTSSNDVVDKVVSSVDDNLKLESANLDIKKGAEELLSPLTAPSDVVVEEDDKDKDQASSSLTLLMDHLKYVANCVVEEADRLHPVKKTLSSNNSSHDVVGVERSIGVQASASSRKQHFKDVTRDVNTESSTKILKQEAMIRELLEIIINDNNEDTSPSKNATKHKNNEKKKKRRVRSNSMDSYYTDDQKFSQHHHSEHLDDKYKDLLDGIKTQELIDLLYNQQKELKIAQMENQLQKMEYEDALKKAKSSTSRNKKTPSPNISQEENPQASSSTDVKRSSSLNRESLKKTSSGNDLKDVSPSSTIKVEENDLVSNGNDKLDVKDLEVEQEGVEYNSYTDIYNAVVKEKESLSLNMNNMSIPPNGNEDRHDEEDSNNNEETQVDDDESIKENLKNNNSLDDHDISPHIDKSDHYQHRRDIHQLNKQQESTVDPAKFASPYSNEELSKFLQDAMSVEVQDKHANLNHERTELPQPPPKEYNVYSRRVSELDSLNHQLQKWKSKLKELKSHEKEMKVKNITSTSTSRLDLTVITARYLPEMKKLSSSGSFQSSLYAELTVESINPYGFEDAQEMYRASRNNQDHDGDGNDTDSTISDISDGESHVDDDDLFRDPEEVLTLV